MTVENPGRQRAAPRWRRAAAAGDPRPRARTAPGVLAVVAAAVFAVVHVVAIAEATGGDYRSATMLAWVAIVGTAATLLMGIAAFVLDRGRRWSAVAIILSLCANPFILTRLLGFVDTLRS